MSDSKEKIGELLENLKDELDVKTYLKIMDMVRVDGLANEQTKNKIISYYRLAHRPNKKEIIDSYLEMDEPYNTNFSQVIEKLREVNHENEAVFSSVLISLIDTNQPLYSTEIVKALGIGKPDQKNDVKKIYEEIINFYFDSKENQRFRDNCVKAFDDVFPDEANVISITKKIDFVLWAIGNQENKTWRDYL